MSAILRDRALAIARTQLGVRERGHNAGPEVDAYLHAVGLGPGQAWCAAFVIWCYSQAAAELHIADLPLRRTGKVMRLWESGRARFASPRPAPGLIYCHAKDPQDPDSAGHCGIVIGHLPDGRFIGIEGNTNALGSREGDSVWENTRTLAYVNLGFLDVGEEITARIRQPRA